MNGSRSSLSLESNQSEGRLTSFGACERAGRPMQLAALAKGDRIPAFFSVREPVEAGGLMSYGIDLAEMFRQVGAYTGRILRGDKPADLPVLQAIKLELVINLQTARALGIEIPPGILSIADDVID